MKKSILFIILILTLIGISLYISYFLNNWRGVFWEDISKRDTHQLISLIIQFTVVAFILVYSSACQTWLQSKLALNLREKLSHWLTNKFLSKTVNNRQFLADINPDQRIAEDCRLLTNNGINLIAGTIGALSRAILFLFVLISFSTTIYNHPAILPLGTLLYSVLGVSMAFLIGKKLVSLTYFNQTAEARYRTGLIKLEDNEHTTRLSEVLVNSRYCFNRQKLLNLWIGTYDQASVIVPIFVILPFYMANPEFSFGMLMQVINAVAETIAALSFLTNNWANVTELKACINRLTKFNSVL